MKREIIVVGAGFSGLTAAYYLRRAGWNVEVYEKRDRPGGLISSEHTPWGLVESAANGLINSLLLEDLFRELGLEILSTRKESRRRYIYRLGLRRWPLSLIESRRLLLDFLPRYLFWRRSLKPAPIETLARWGERTMGAEATQYLLSPAFQGIYGSEAARLSASLVLRRWFSKQRRPRKPRQRGTVAPIKGVGHLLEQLAFYLEKQNVNFHYAKEFDWAKAKKGQPVVICTSCRQAAQLLRKPEPQLAETLAKVEMLALISVTVFYPKHPSDVTGFGCLFPRSEGFDVLGILFNEQIFVGRGDHRSETWIFGGSRKPNVCNWSDEFILSKIKVERMKIFDRHVDPVGYRIHRWPEALPHYTPELETALEKIGSQKNNIHLLGNYLGDIGLTQILERSHRLATGLTAELKA